MRTATVLITLLAPLWAQSTNHWIYLDSAESDTPPVLVVRLEDGSERELPVADDTVLIAYLADRAWARLPRLSIDESDQNRSLLRFDLARGLTIERAELRVAAHPGNLPPLGDTRFQVHAITQAWRADVTWSDGPAFDPDVAAVGAVPFGGGEVTVDLTGLARRWTAAPGENFGVALRVLTDDGEPKTTPAEVMARNDPGAGLTARIREQVGWRASIRAAQTEAEATDRLVLAFVVCDVHQPAGSTHERALSVHALLDPTVRALLGERFVPVRVSTPAHLHLGPDPRPEDPLRALGTDCVTARAPALVVSTAGGEARAVLASIGTFDATLIADFLRHAADLPRSEGSAAPPDPGVARWRAGREDAARAHWQEVAGSDEHDAAARLRAEAWLLWPGLLDATASRRAVRYDPELSTTERPVDPTAEATLVAASIDQLLSRQRSDGRWAHPDQTMWDAAITALCAKALDRWLPWLDGERRERADAAVARAEKWLASWVVRVAPETADSFGAAYVVDLFAARRGRSELAATAAPKAVELLLRGQLPNGAWSYNLRFGTGWRGGFGGWPKTDKGRAHSINTGVALVALVRARDAGLQVPAEPLQKGADALDAMKSSPTTFTYTWPDPRSFDGPDQSIGKAPVCLEAMVALDARPPEDLERAIEEFLRWRHNLRATVKLTPGWIGPSGTSSYFFFHAYHHAAEAIAAAGGAHAAVRLELLRQDVLRCAELDGTWVDYENSGKSYGTAMALSVLGIARAHRNE